MKSAKCPSTGALQPQYYVTACLDQCSRGPPNPQYVYSQCYPSISTLIHPLHCTLGDWVHCLLVTSSSHCRFSREGAGGLSHNRGVLQWCEVGGRQRCQLAEKRQSCIYTSAPKPHMLPTGVMYCSTLHLASLQVAYHHIQHTSNHVLLAACNQLCVEGTGRQSWFSHGKLAMVRMCE